MATTDDAGESVSEVERFREVADDLHAVVRAMDAVDLNALLDDDVRTLLEAKQTIEELTLRYRRDQHTAEDRA
jgi:hypothetical protein